MNSRLFAREVSSRLFASLWAADVINPSLAVQFPKSFFFLVGNIQLCMKCAKLGVVFEILNFNNVSSLNRILCAVDFRFEKSSFLAPSFFPFYYFK